MSDDDGERILDNDRPFPDRCADMMCAYEELKVGGEFEIYTGVATTDHRRIGGVPALVVDIDGELIGFTTQEAAIIIGMVTKYMDLHGPCSDPNCTILRMPALLNLLDRGITEAEAMFNKGRLQ